MTRNSFFCCFTAAIILAALPLRAADSRERGKVIVNIFQLDDAYVPLDREAEDAISRAQAVLASRQKSDGSWNTRYSRGNAGEVAFALLALMVDGTVPGEGKYGKHIGRGINFLLGLQHPNGLIAVKNNAVMYQHALATLVLSEYYGMTLNPNVRAALIKAVNLIVEVQHSAGGWRYNPRPEKGDISVTVMQVMALRSAAEAGIFVPKQTIDRAIRFIKSCYNSKEHGFAYMAANGPAGFARTAAGVVSLQTLGLHDDPLIKDAVSYMMEKGFKPKTEWYWYGHYYASVALYHFGGEHWKAYYPRIKQVILEQWAKRFPKDNVLDTAWGILILGVPFRYLPIYQR